MPSNRRQIPFTGAAYRNSNSFLSAQESINYYLERLPSVEGERYILRGSPGLLSWVNLATTTPVRGMIVGGNNLYVVSSDKLFKITSGKVATEVSGSINTTFNQTVSMAYNGLQVMIVDSDATGWIYTVADDTLEQITDSNFPGAGTVTLQDGFFIVNVPDTSQFWKSNLNDGLTWDSLDFSSAGWKPDNLVRVFSDHRDLWLPGEDTIEIWYNNGDASSFPFTRREGAEMEIGLAAPESMARINNAVFWLGRTENGHGQVFQALGFKPQVISTDPITEAINSYDVIEDAIGFTYLLDNAAMYEITFPTADASWVYDSSINQWHERQSRRTDLSGRTVTGRHRVQHHTFFAGKHLFGDFETGKIWEMTPESYKEGAFHMVSQRSAITFEKNQDPITVDELQVLFTPGVGRVSGQGSSPVVIVSWSGDGGKTWGNEHQLSLGALGEYENRVREMQLGQNRNWVFRVKVSDPVNRDILDGYAVFEVDDG